eukprot:GHRR01020750.1.p1 GENE.GHRR01020750.1~~GHRR01020750.1.p1  ORF type:complete len:202 (+),score=82.95 GHRR01020750.1:121-726(+)
MGFISPLKALQAASRTIVPCRYAPGSSRRETLFAATIVIAAGVVQPAEAAVPDHILHIQQPHENQIIDPSHAVYASAETAAAARQGASSAAAANSNCSKLDPVLASAFVAAVDKVVQQQGILPEEQLQRERYKLQQQEYKYYLGGQLAVARMQREGCGSCKCMPVPSVSLAGVIELVLTWAAMACCITACAASISYTSIST